MQLDFSDDSADDADNNNKSKVDEDYIQTTMSDNTSNRNLTKLLILLQLVIDMLCQIMLELPQLRPHWLIRYYSQSAYESIIGPQKLGDEKRRSREERVEKQSLEIKKLTFLYFIGKKFTTGVLVKSNKTGRWSPKMKDEHYVVLTERGNDYNLCNPKIWAWEGKSRSDLLLFGSTGINKSTTVCCWL